MQGRISIVLAGVALALGGGVAGATLVAGPAPQEAPTAAASLAADSQKLARANAQHALHAAQRARRIARRARAKSNESLATAVSLLDDVDNALADSANALTAAQQAEGDAANALQAANNANSRVDSTQLASNAENGVVGTSEENDWVSLGGPTVTATVPSSGLIEVWASVRFEDPVDGMVSLFEDGQLVPLNQEGLCTGPGSPLGDDAILAGEFGPGGAVTLSTPPAALFGAGCGTPGSSAAPILLHRPSGTHTYELRYADCGCDPADAEFSQRVLRVGPRL